MYTKLQRIETLEQMILEDARRATGTEQEDNAVKALVERLITEARGGLVKAPKVGTWAHLKAVPQARAEQTEGVRAGVAAATLLGLLAQAEVRRYSLKKTFRCLYDALAKGFVEADASYPEQKEMIVKCIRSLKTHELEDDWGAALRGALGSYYDDNALCEFIAESDKYSNKAALVKMAQRRAGAAEIGGYDLSRLIFEARCGHALGRNPNTLALVEADAIAFIKRMAQLAEWKFSMSFVVMGLENERVRIIHPNTIEVVGDLNTYGSTRNIQALVHENLDENGRRLREAWSKLEKPEDPTCVVRLVVNGISRNFNL